jgi:UDPglucose 6-dehydrogenase
MIGFVGLSHLGLNYSLATAAKGFDVVAFDPDTKPIEQLRRGIFPIAEPGFEELFRQHRGHLHYTADPAELARCDLVFYSLDVPTDARGAGNVAPLTALIEATLPRLAPAAAAVVLGQVAPGYTRALAARHSSRSGAIYYQVETLVFGDAVRRALEPERYIVGAADPAQPLAPAFRAWHAAFGCPVLAMRYESAELAKIAINLFLVSSVSTTNAVAELCERIGADWSEIAPALRLDRRIGPHAYLQPGLGLAGGNLERDLATTQHLAAAHQTDFRLIEAWQQNSARRKAWAREVLQQELLGKNPRARVAVWGLAYKAETHSTKNSAALELLASVPACEFHVYDPAVVLSAAQSAGVTTHPSALAALAQADALVVMTPWKEFSAIIPADIRARLKGTLVIDPFGALDGNACRAAGLRHRQLGKPATLA